MILIIDAYNVLKQMAGRDITEKERMRFVAQLGKYAKKKGHKVILVFDAGPHGWAHKERIHGVYVVYSGAQETADCYIKRYIEEHRQYDLLLVTSDRDIAHFASRMNIESLDSTAFYGILQRELEHGSLDTAGPEGSLVKTTRADVPELDALMEEASRQVHSKSEDFMDNVERESPARRLSKKERKMEKKIKKL